MRLELAKVEHTKQLDETITAYRNREKRLERARVENEQWRSRLSTDLGSLRTLTTTPRKKSARERSIRMSLALFLQFSCLSTFVVGGVVLFLCLAIRCLRDSLPLISPRASPKCLVFIHPSSLCVDAEPKRFVPSVLPSCLLPQNPVIRKVASPA